MKIRGTTQLFNLPVQPNNVSIPENGMDGQDGFSIVGPQGPTGPQGPAGTGSGGGQQGLMPVNDEGYEEPLIVIPPPDGYWIHVPYDAANFLVVVGTGSWTVQAADQVTYAYVVIGRTITISLVLDATSITGTVSQVGVNLPNGLKALGTNFGIAYIYDNSTTTFTLGTLRTFANSGLLDIFNQSQSNWQVSVNNTYVRVSITFELAP